MRDLKTRRTYAVPIPIWVYWEGNKRKLDLKSLWPEDIRTEAERVIGQSMKHVPMLWRQDKTTEWHSMPAAFDDLEVVRRQLIG